MNNAFLVAVALAAMSAAAKASPASVLALDLEPNGVSDPEAKVINSLIVQALSRHPQLKVLSSTDIQQMVKLAVEQQAVGCETTSCLAEVAGAMGASFVVYGQVGRLDDVVVVQLNLFDSQRGVAVSREKVETSKLGALSRLIEPTVDRLMADVLRGQGSSVATKAAEDAFGWLPWAVVGGGVALAAAGAVGVAFGVEPLGRHRGVEEQLRALSEQPSLPGLGEARALHEEAKRASDDWQQWGAFALVGGAAGLLAGAAVVTAGVAWALSSSAEVE